MPSKILLSIILLCIGLSSQANLLNRINSVVYENLQPSVKVQLFPANFDHYVVQIQSDIGFDKVTTEFLNARGNKWQLSPFAFGESLSIELLPASFDEIVTGILSTQSQVKALTVTIYGDFNQQRMLGHINRLLRKHGIQTKQQTPQVNGNWRFIPFYQADAVNEVSQPQWQSLLFASLLNCQDAKTQLPNFLYTENGVFCAVNPVFEDVTDSEIARIKETYFDQISRMLVHPVPMVDYITRFAGESSLELSSSFLQSIPNQSIDETLGFYYKSKPISGAEQNLDENLGSYYVPEELKSQVTISTKASGVVNILFYVEKPVCQYFNCTLNNFFASTNLLDSNHSTLFEFEISKKFFTRFLKQLNEVLLSPMVASGNVSQEDIYLSFEGDFLPETLENSLLILTQLPEFDYAFDGLSFSKEQTQHAIDLQALPGEPFWAASELLYFSLLLDASELKISKKNSLLSLHHNEKLSLSLSRSMLITENNDSKALQRYIQEYAANITEAEFESLKSAALTNSKLLKKTHAQTFLQKVFRLQNYQQQLIEQLNLLTFEKYNFYLQKMFAQNSS